ncbi:MAG: Xaa-Pro peptidase family protein [Steroidobacteraceae bacterium]|nr:aminopeptidase P family protein [Pseudomonadota bacterium]MBP6106865.1 aminopeptidase P family protein [Steroidobacteraceae bacterium]MBP7012357.1 aminopeptidase P family protein [Steroidobacteraceae bacterium]
MLELAGRSPVLWQVLRPGTEYSSENPKDLELYRKIGEQLPGVSIRSLGWTLDNMRSRHSADELAIMQRTIRMSEEGFRAAVKAIRPGVLEGAVEAEAERIWKANGARRPSYPSIVGSGQNSTILHYPRTAHVMKDGELILMDMSAAFAQMKPGVYYEDLDAAARKVIDDAGYGDYFIHGLGHFVGLDVHDAGAYQEPLQAGMVITLEPGIYIPEKGIGIRIEDEVERWMAGD